MRAGLPQRVKHKRFLKFKSCGRFACDQPKASSIDEQIFCVGQVCSNTMQIKLCSAL